MPLTTGETSYQPTYTSSNMDHLYNILRLYDPVISFIMVVTDGSQSCLLPNILKTTGLYLSPLRLSFKPFFSRSHSFLTVIPFYPTLFDRSRRIDFAREELLNS